MKAEAPFLAKGTGLEILPEIPLIAERRSPALRHRARSDGSIWLA